MARLEHRRHARRVQHGVVARVRLDDGQRIGIVGVCREGLHRLTHLVTP